jgi:hypothetical protein
LEEALQDPAFKGFNDCFVPYPKYSANGRLLWWHPRQQVRKRMISFSGAKLERVEKTSC